MIFFNDLNLEKKDALYLSFLIILSLLIIYKLIDYHLSGGIFSPDKCAYLSNALTFAGLDFYHISDPGEFYLSPTISFLTSLLFRLGFVDYSSILIVTGILGFLGIIGFYFLLKCQFSSLMSFTGSVVMLSLSVVILNLASGLLDFPAVAISIWIVLFTVLAVNKNSKYYIVIFPLFVIGFFTRYTVGFILPIILMYYLINKDIIEKIDLLFSNTHQLKIQCINYIKSDEFKYIFLSLILGVILLIIYCKVIHELGSTLGFIEQSQSSFAGDMGSRLSVDFSDDLFFYLKNFSFVLFHDSRQFDLTLAYSLFSIIALGVLLKAKDIVMNIKDVSRDAFKTKYFDAILTLCLIISVLGIIFGIFLYKQIIINIFILIFFITLYGIIRKFEIDKESLTFLILNLAWFFINLTYFSYYPIKTLRYIMPIIPPFIYFLIYFLDYIVNVKLKRFNISEKYLNFIPVLLIVVLLFSSFTYIDQMSIPEKANDLKDVSNYIIETDDSYHSKIIVAYDTNHRIVRWYLNDYIIPISDDNIDLLDFVNVDYVIYDKQLDLDGYDEIYHKGEIYLYGKLN